MKDYYIAFDSLIKEGNDVLEYMIGHQIEIINHAKKAKCYELYSSSADDLGILTPSLIRDKITSGYHKGRRLKQAPLKGGYVLYEFDNTMKPLRIRNYTKKGHLDFTFYFNLYSLSGRMAGQVFLYGTPCAARPAFIGRYPPFFILFPFFTVPPYTCLSILLYLSLSLSSQPVLPSRLIVPRK